MGDAQSKFGVGDLILFSRPEYGVSYTGVLLSQVGDSWRVGGQLGLCPEVFMTLVKRRALDRPYDPSKACHDCPIGGREGGGPVCENTAACDRQCERDMVVWRRERAAYLAELEAKRKSRD